MADKERYKTEHNENANSKLKMKHIQQQQHQHQLSNDGVKHDNIKMVNELMK